MTLLLLAVSLWAQDPVPQPKPVPHVKVHAKPKPLPAGATTHDWTNFLGPTHNNVSAETKLLHNWGKDGPKLIWEMKKGTGYSSPAISGSYLVYMHRSENKYD